MLPHPDLSGRLSLFPMLHAAREQISVYSFFYVFLPPIIGYYVLAALVCLPGTRTVRIGLLPLVLFLACRAAFCLDLSSANERMIYLNQGLALAMLVLGFRAILWAQSEVPYKRLERALVGSGKRLDAAQLFLDSSDLAFGLRGIGWDWSQGMHIPPETRPTSSKYTFVLWTLASVCLHLVVFDLLHYSVQRFGPDTFGSVKGGSIFNERLSPLTRYSCSTFITFLSGLIVYCAIQIPYDVLTIFGIVVLGQLPAQWPPIFDKPWETTSLSDFWARRWHQLFRHTFIGIGAAPLRHVFGRVGGVMGVFLVSGILHYVGLWGMGKGSDVLGMIGFFMFMGFGVLLEALCKKITGCRVRGWIGRIWTAVWLLGWSNVLVDAWARKGLIGSLFIPDEQRLPVKLFGPLPEYSFKT